MFGSPKPPRLIFRYAVEDAERLKAAAARAGMTTGDAIREAIAAWLRRHARRPPSSPASPTDAPNDRSDGAETPAG